MSVFRKSVSAAPGTEAGSDIGMSSQRTGVPSEHVTTHNRRNWRDLVAETFYYTGAFRLLQRLSRSWELRLPPQRSFPQLRRISADKYVILCYHQVGTKGIPYYCSLAPESFELQMRFLRENYRVVSLSQLCEELDNPQTRGPAVAVTFDDGYRGLYTHAYPVLKKYQIPATIYLTVNSIETGEVAWYDRIFLALQVFPEESLDLNLDRPRRFLLRSQQARLSAATEIVTLLRRMPDARRSEICVDLDRRVSLPRAELMDRMLTWGQIREMTQSGILFGSHTMNHRVVSRLALEEVDRELRESRAVLEQRLSKPILDFAFPFGQAADCGAVHSLVALCGYRSAVTTSWGINTAATNRFALRRVQIGEGRSLPSFAFQLNQLFFRFDDDASKTDPLAAMQEESEALGTSSELPSHR